MHCCSATHVIGAAENGRRVEPEAVPAFREFPLDVLRRATNSFSSDQIVSESGEKAPNFVYKGRLDHNRWIAIKRFPKAAWPDAKGFMVIYSIQTTLPPHSTIITSTQLNPFGTFALIGVKLVVSIDHTTLVDALGPRIRNSS